MHTTAETLACAQRCNYRRGIGRRYNDEGAGEICTFHVHSNDPMKSCRSWIKIGYGRAGAGRSEINATFIRGPFT